MAEKKPPINKGDFARRGDEIFHRQIEPQLRGRSPDDLVAIDVETVQFEVGAEEMDLVDRLANRLPDAQIWLRRVGSRPVRRFGPRGPFSPARP